MENSEFNLKEEEANLIDREKIRYPEQIHKLRELKAQPSVMLELIDAIAKDFFWKRFRTKKSAEYSELHEIFEKKGNPAAAGFCARMLEATYAGSPITKEKIMDLIGDLEFIMDKEDPGTTEEIEKRGPLENILEKIKVLESEKEKKRKDYYVDDVTKKIIKTKLLKEREREITSKQKESEKVQNTASESKEEAKEEKTLQDANFKEDEQTPQERRVENIDDLYRIKSKIDKGSKPISLR